MNTSDKQQLAALARVSLSPDLQAFRDYLQQHLDKTTTELRRIDDFDAVRLNQGRAQALEDLIEMIEEAPKILSKQQ